MICGAELVVADAGAGWPGIAPRAAIPPVELLALEFFGFFFLVFLSYKIFD
jgi:hypothetical protein